MCNTNVADVAQRKSAGRKGLRPVDRNHPPLLLIFNLIKINKLNHIYFIIQLTK